LQGLQSGRAVERAGMTRRGVMRAALKLPIVFYRKVISPLKPPTCRFYPSCSQYALEAIEKHGAAKGSLLAARRIARCHPFNPGGFDPVPPAKDEIDNKQSDAP